MFVRSRDVNIFPREEVACQNLVKKVGSNETSDDNSASPLKMVDRLKRMLDGTEKSATNNNYHDVGFIFGSAAIVERLWSKANFIQTKHRRRMTPMLFESLLFLKENSRFWNDATVLKAVQMTSRKTEKKISEDQATLTIESETIDSDCD